MPSGPADVQTCHIGTFCFVAGTLVVMSDGTLKPIEAVQVGEQVLAKDESTGEVSAKKVTRLFQRQAPSTLLLSFSGEKIETTSEHPFYVEHKGFIPAGLLAVGNAIVTRAGPALQVLAKEERKQASTVYNFSVQDNHTYFVGRSGLWVHNVECKDLALGLRGNLGAFKNTVPDAKNFRDLGIDGWARQEATDALIKYMNDAATIHFDLSDIRWINKPNEGILTGPADFNRPPGTAWELRTVWDNPQLKGKTKFYHRGREVTPEDVLRITDDGVLN